jgi:c-di-GMP-binding flagellar brake protein YcgR
MNMDANTASGTPNRDEDDERFFLTGRTEILFALRNMIRRGEMVTVSFNDGADMILTTLLSVDPAHGALIFDWGGSETANRKLLRSERSFFIAKPDGIKTQFAVAAVRETVFGDHRAFVVDLPTRVVRLQRRVSYRVLTPLARPLMVALAIEAEAQPLMLPLHDLGVAGIAVTQQGNAVPFEAGLRLHELRFDLPEFGEVACDADVRHATLADSSAAKRPHRIGLRFHRLPHVMQARIQRYTVSVERARRSMTPD